MSWSWSRSRSASLILTLGLLTSLSLAQDWDGSGLDLESYDSGDGPEDDASSDITFEDRRHQDVVHGSSNHDRESGRVFTQSSRSFWDEPDVRTAVISGGVTGVILAVVVAGVLIYRWRKKETEGFILSRRKDSDEYYLDRRRGQFVV